LGTAILGAEEEEDEECDGLNEEGGQNTDELRLLDESE
jgi:hypothetical protein